MKETKVTQEIANSIDQNLATLFTSGRQLPIKYTRSRTSTSVCQSRLILKTPEELDSVRFAVRSSAVGEDSSDLSAAGQNETVLGCAGDVDSLCRALAQCWASLYAYQSVEYRR